MLSTKTLKGLSNENLVKVYSAACFASVHHPTKTNFAELDKIERELMKRLEANENG